MDNRSEVRDFLTGRRARLSPEAAGVVSDGRQRRVPGLRRQEVAELAGVSIEYYTRLERGQLAGVSAAVLDAVARALHLDDAERDHLFDLARAQTPASGRSPRRPGSRRAPQVSPQLQDLLDAFTGPAFLRNDRLDVLAANLLGRAVYAEMFEDPQTPPNLARFTFLDERAHRFHPDWNKAADDVVAILRTAAGRDPDDEHLTALVGRLATRSPQFRTRWSAHPVKRHQTGTKHFHLALVGDLHLNYQVLELPGQQPLSLLAYTPVPDTGTAEALQVLASWSTPDTAHRATSRTAATTPTTTGPARAADHDAKD